MTDSGLRVGTKDKTNVNRKKESMELRNSHSINKAVETALDIAVSMAHEYIMPEHLLMGLIQQEPFKLALQKSRVDYNKLHARLTKYLKDQDKKFGKYQVPVPSAQFTDLVQNACTIAKRFKKEFAGVREYIVALANLQDSMAAYILDTAIEDHESEFMEYLTEAYPQFLEYEDDTPDLDDDDLDDDDDMFDDNGQPMPFTSPEDWKSLVTNISEVAKTHTPLIGREKELDRTIQVICRMEKNNPLHVGDPGVGKTALIYGLANLINKGQVPDRLKGATIYGMDMGQLLAGAQFRGDFEKRLKLILDGASKEKSILYLDEIHNIIGAGRGSDGGPDASNILKPYLESGAICFVGATTHEEYNRKMLKDGAVTRRFQTIDIKEPSVEEAIKIVTGLQPSLQKYHNVTYRKEALEYAVTASAKHISGRCLPDKAIDLLDEAGAYLEVHPVENRRRSWVTKSLIDDILVKVCKIQATALKEEDNGALMTLRERMLESIYGQDKAIDEVTEAVMMAKAGLTEDDKPLASLLFVGPTGVGKTEVARMLSKVLGVELVRFDMSEYTEKHAVAKLIGSPAGYVGYEDGGLLTDAIRKTPNCVLLLDEIEKAHSDIYNILLQVMDYARLTDNRGQKADFRNVILIMTSNAGAQFAAQANVGFTGNVTKGEAMMKQVKKTFKPEFINRLSDIVVFNEMDKNMARLILNKKLKELKDKVAAKELTLKISDAAFEHMLGKCFTKEYGAREADRVIAHELKPLIMREILFGKRKKGSTLAVDFNNGVMAVRNSSKSQSADNA